MPQQSQPLQDMTVLLAMEDDFLRIYLASVLQGLGAGMVLAARTGEEALDRMADATQIAVAAVGTGLSLTHSWELPRMLKARGMPFMFLSMNPTHVRPEDLLEFELMTWPFAGHQLFDGLTRLHGARTPTETAKVRSAD